MPCANSFSNHKLTLKTISYQILNKCNNSLFLGLQSITFVRKILKHLLCARNRLFNHYEIKKTIGIENGKASDFPLAPHMYPYKLSYKSFKL